MPAVTDSYGITIDSTDNTKPAFTSSGKGADQLRNKFQGVEKGMASMVQAQKALMGLGFAPYIMRVVGAVKQLVSELTSLGDQMSKASEKFGVGVEVLSQLKFASERAGSSFESVGTALRNVARKASTNSAEFAKWGLELRNTSGEIKSIQQLFLDSADLIANMESATLKAAAAQDIFGRAGIELTPLLNQGAAGIREVMDVATELGVTMSTKFATQSAMYVDAMLDAKSASQALKRELLAGLLPAMTDTLGTIKESLIWWREHKEIIEGVGTALKIVSPLYWAARVSMAAVGLVTGDATEATEDYELAKQAPVLLELSLL